MPAGRSPRRWSAALDSRGRTTPPVPRSCRGLAVFFLLPFVMLALAVAAVVSVGVFVLRMAFWMVLLPLRMLFGLLFVPFWIAKTVLKVAFGVLLLPLMLIVGGVLAVAAFLAALVAVVTPLVPLLILGLLIWVVARSFRRPAAIA